MSAENQEREKSELDKAIKLIQEQGFAVVYPLSLVAKPYIRELSDVLEAAEYQLDEAKIERNETGRATGRIMLSVFPFKVLEKKEREGDA